MAKKVQYTTNQPSATTDYLAADNTWKTMSGGGGGATWGSITGTLSTQTDLQTALNAKENTITGAASTITTSNLTGSRALVSNGGGKVDVSAITTTELGYLSGVTSDIQTQLNAKQGTLTLTTTGTSGAATLVGSTLNIPQYTSLAVLQAVYGGSSLNAGQIAYAAFENIIGVITNENTRRVIMPVACTMSKFYTVSGSTQPATGSLTLTIRKNIADTILVITIAAGSVGGTYSNTTNSVSFAAGDAMAIKFVNNATSTSASIISVSSLLS